MTYYIVLNKVSRCAQWSIIVSVLDQRADGLNKLTMAIGTNYNRAQGQYYINTQKII